MTSDDEEKYSMVLRGLLEDHKDVIGTLAQGFKESRKHVQVMWYMDNQTYFGSIIIAKLFKFLLNYIIVKHRKKMLYVDTWTKI